MDLDKRIIEGKKPLDCFDTENRELMKSFLNKEGYFSNKLKNFCFLNKCSKRILNNVFKEKDQCFETIFKDCNINYWKYFLPAEWVKESEKKCRPYKDVQEFFNDIGCSVGDVINYRRKSDGTKYRSTIVGTSHSKDDSELVFFCNEWYTMKELFDICEVYTSGDWKPFGIIEE